MSALVPQIIASGSIASRDSALPATTIATAPAAGLYRVNVSITLGSSNNDVLPFLTFTSPAGQQITQMSSIFSSLGSGQPSLGASFVLDSAAAEDIQLSTTIDGTPTYSMRYSVESL